MDQVRDRRAVPGAADGGARPSSETPVADGGGLTRSRPSAPGQSLGTVQFGITSKAGFTHSRRMILFSLIRIHTHTHTHIHAYIQNPYKRNDIVSIPIVTALNFPILPERIPHQTRRIRMFSFPKVYAISIYQKGFCDMIYLNTATAFCFCRDPLLF